MPRRIALAIAVIGTSPGAFAQDAPTDAAVPRVTREPRMAPITVTATRTERSADAVPASVTVLDAARLEAVGARDLKDALLDEADVEMHAPARRFTAASSGTGRGGNESVNIRGLEGNRVLMLVDGIRIPSVFSFGPFVAGRGDYVDTDSLGRIELLRGPASTQYGSDGLAGAVNLVTLTPDDVLAGRDAGGFVRGGYSSVDRSRTGTLAVAGQTGDVKALLLYTRRDGHETRNKGDNDAANTSRTAPNPLDASSDSLLGKVAWKATAEHELGLASEWVERRFTSDLLSGRAASATAPTSVIDLDASDSLRRARVSLRHDYTPAAPGALGLAGWHSQIYFQDARQRQITWEDRLSAADRTRDNRYTEKIVGLSSQAEYRLPMHAQRLTWGLDASRSTLTGVRDGSTPPAGETFPSRPFPDTGTTMLGAFAQDELRFGQFEVIPGLRFDHYRLAPSTEGYTGAVRALSDQAVTPRLGAIWHLRDGFAPYAQWALGFKAPQADQVNTSFANPAQGYTSIANPDLKPEHARSIEIGARGRLDALRWQLAAYDNRYRDFISQEVVSGRGTVADPLVFQYVNLEDARIHGVEARADWRPLARLRLEAGVATAHGNSSAGGEKTPLDSVAPLRAVTSATWDADGWSARLRWRHSAAKDASRVAADTPFLPGAHDVLDVGASWRLTPSLRLIANIENLGDVKYWRWSDVRGQTAGGSGIDAFTAPGRNWQIALRADF